MRHTLGLVFLVGCGSAVNAPPTVPVDTDSPSTAAQPLTNPDQPMGSEEDAPSPSETLDVPSAVSFDASDAQAREICEQIAGSLDIVTGCRFLPGGGDFAGIGRVDVLELQGDGMNLEERSVYLVLRRPEDEGYANTLRLAIEQHVPGQSDEFRFTTPLALHGQRVELRLEASSTTYPNTGDPDAPSGAYSDTTMYLAYCDSDAVCDLEETGTRSSGNAPY